MDNKMSINYFQKYVFFFAVISKKKINILSIMDFTYVYFLTKSDEIKSKRCNWIPFFCNNEEILNNMIRDLHDEKNLRMVKYNEFNKFNEDNKEIYYNGYTSSNLLKPLRGKLYVRISSNYYVESTDYTNKKWEFHDELYKYVFSPFGLKGISNNSHNDIIKEQKAGAGVEAIAGGLDVNLNHSNRTNTDLEKTLEFKKLDNLDDLILAFNSQTYDEKISFLQNQIENKHKKKIFASSIDTLYNLIKLRTEQKLNNIEVKVSIKINDIRGIESSLNERFSSFNIGLSFNSSNKELIDEEVILNIIFYDYQEKKKKINQFLPENTDVNTHLSNSNTPLIEAVWNQDEKAVKMLVEKGALIDTKQGDGITPLMFAVEKGNINIVNFLIKKGANVNEKANCKNTPLIIAAWNGQSECAKILINANANIHSKQCDGSTALHFAAGKDFGNVAKVLLEAGADEKIKNLRGESSIDLANNHGMDGDVINIINSYKK